MRARSSPVSWKSYRQRNWLAAILLLAGLPAAFLIAVALKLLTGIQDEVILAGSIALWAFAWGWAAIRVARWPCPRCGAPWLSNQAVELGAPRRCAKCALGLYEEP